MAAKICPRNNMMEMPKRVPETKYVPWATLALSRQVQSIGQYSVPRRCHRPAGNRIQWLSLHRSQVSSIEAAYYWVRHYTTVRSGHCFLEWCWCKGRGTIRGDRWRITPIGPIGWLLWEAFRGTLYDWKESKEDLCVVVWASSISPIFVQQHAKERSWYQRRVVKREHAVITKNTYTKWEWEAHIYQIAVSRIGILF